MTADPRPLKPVHFILGIILSALSGALLLLSFPPYGLWPLIWFACVPYRFAQHRLFPLKWSSLAETVALLVWLGPFLGRMFGTQYGPFFTYLGVWIAILTFFISKGRGFHEQTGYRWFVLEGVAGWVGFEMVRAAFIPLVATSAFIGYTQASQAWLIQPVSIFSVYGLNLLIMLVNFALTLGLMALVDRRWRPAGAVAVSPRSTRNWLIIAGAVAAAWVGVSLILWNAAPKQAETVRVAALQPGYDLPAFQDETRTARERFDEFAAQAREAAGQGARILVTPEMMFDFDPQQEFTAEFRALAAETGAYIFIDYAIAVEGQPWRNESVLLAPSGEFFPVYAKNHAPPGEPLSAGAGVYPVFDTPLGRLAAMICHDANYTDVARRLAANGAGLITTGLNEFGGFGEQYWTNATFRAVENRSAVIVTARQSGSAVIDPYGRQVSLSIAPDERLVLIGDVAIGPGGALYTRLGDLLGWVSMAGFAFFIVYPSILQRRARKPGQPRRAK